jgi:hypothetical protein
MTSEWDVYKERTLFDVFEVACLIEGYHPRLEYLDNPPDRIPYRCFDLQRFMVRKSLIYNRPPGDIESILERVTVLNQRNGSLFSREDYHEKESRKKFYWGAQIRWREILEYVQKNDIRPAFLSNYLNESIEVSSPLEPEKKLEKALTPETEEFIESKVTISATKAVIRGLSEHHQKEVSVDVDILTKIDLLKYADKLLRAVGIDPCQKAITSHVVKMLGEHERVPSTVKPVLDAVCKLRKIFESS